MAINIVGAVGIRVRPDARRFRPEAKREVMAAMQGIEGEVPIVPELEDDAARLRAELKRLTKGLKEKATIEVEVDSDRAKKEAKDLADSMERNNKVHIEVETNLKKLGEELDDARNGTRDLKEEFKSLNKSKTIDLEQSIKRLSKAEDDLTKQVEKQDAARAKLASRTEEYSIKEERSSKRVKNAYESAQRSLKKELEETQRLQEIRTDASETVIRERKELRDIERSYGDVLADQYEALAKNNTQYERAVAEGERKLAQEDELHKAQMSRYYDIIQAEKDLKQIRTLSSSNLKAFLEERARENERFVDTLNRILTTSRVAPWSKEFDDLRDYVESDFARDHVAHLRVEADTAKAEAELKALERDRVVRIAAIGSNNLLSFLDRIRPGGEMDKSVAHFGRKYSSMATGLARSLSGLNQISRLTDAMVDGAIRMDQIAMSAARMGTAIGAVGGTITSTIGLLTTMGTSITSILKGASALPAMLVTLGTFGFALKEGFAEIKGAFANNGDTVRNLNSELADSIQSVSLLFQTTQKYALEDFWGTLADDMIEFQDSVKPIAVLYKDAMGAAADFYAGAVRGVNDWYKSGDMSKSLPDIAKGFTNAAKAAHPLTQALLDMVTIGSQYMPQLGQQVADLSQKFANFMRVSKENGSMAEWMEEGGRQVQYLGRSIWGTVRAFGAIASAANEAGFGGLRSFAEAMEAADSKLRSPLWQHGMTNIFRGARQGAHNAAEGIGELGDAFMLTSKSFEQMGGDIGTIVGDMSRHLGTMMTNSRFLPGLADFFDDVKVAAGNSGPMMRDMGDAFGDAARTGGELVKAGQLITGAFFRAWASMDGLNDGMEDIIPVLADFAVKVIDLAHVFTGVLGNALGSAMSWFAGLPQPLQQAALAAGGLALAMSKLSPMGMIIGGLASRFPGFQRGIDGVTSAAGRMQGAFTNTMRAVRNSGGNFAKVRSELGQISGTMSRSELATRKFAINMAQVGTGVGQVKSSFSGLPRTMQGAVQGLHNLGGGAKVALAGLGNGAMQGLRGAASGLMGALGGPWGLAITGAVVALGLFAQKSAEAKRMQSELKATVSETGEATAATTTQIRDNLEGMDGFGDSWRQATDLSLRYFDANAQRFPELTDQIKGTGRTVSEVAQLTAEGGQGFKDYQSSIYEAASEAGRFGTLGEEMSIKLFGTADAADMTRSELINLGNAIGSQYDIVQEAARGQAELANTLGISEASGKQMSDAMKILNDEFSSASDRVGAFKSAMDVANGGILSQRDALLQQQESLKGMDESFQAVGEAVAGGVQPFESFTTAAGDTVQQLNSTSEATRGLESSLRSSYDSTLQYAMSIYDSAIKSGDTVAEATEKAMKPMRQWTSDAGQGFADLGLDAQASADVIRSITGEDYVAEVTFMGKTEEFMAAKQLVENAGGELDGEAFVAFLQANPDAAVSDIETLVQKGIQWSSADYAASLTADGADARAMIDEVIARGETWNNEEYQAVLHGDSSDFLDAVIAAEAKGESLNSAEYRASIGMNDEQFRAVLSQVENEGANFNDTEWIARMDLENPGFAEKLFASKQGLGEISNGDWEANVQTNMDEVRRKQQELSSGLGNLNGTTATVDVATNAGAAALALEVVKLKAEGLSNEKIQMKLELTDDEFSAIMSGMPEKWQSTKGEIEGNPAKPTADSSAADQVIAQIPEKWRSNADIMSAIQAHLKANPDDVEGAVELAKSLIDGFEGKEASADLNANDHASEVVDQVMGAAGRYNGSQFSSELGANDSASGKIGAVNAFAIAMWGSQLFEGILGANDSDGTSKISSLASFAGSSWGGKLFDAILGADDQASPTVDGAKDKAASFDGQSFDAKLGADILNVSSQVRVAEVSLISLTNKPYDVKITANAGNVAAVIASARAMVASFNSMRAQATLSATAGNVGAIVAMARAQVSSFNNARGQATLTANAGLVGGIVAMARAQVSSFNGMRAVATLATNAGPAIAGIASARGAGLGFAASRFTASLGANIGPFSGVIAAARAMGAGFAGSTFRATLAANQGPFQGVVNAMQAVGRQFASRTFRATLDGNTGPFRAAQASAMALGNSFNGRTFRASFTGDASGARAAYNAALSAGNAWHGRTFTAHFKGTKSNSEGGFYAQGFSNGGIMRALKHYAAGGTRKAENHRAMIAQPSSVYRVWAEPETGGEAYIPLASSKRDRSEAILGQVAEHFGLTVSRYANGGTSEHVGGVQPPSTQEVVATAPASNIDPQQLTAAMRAGADQALAGWGVEVVENSRGFYARMKRAERENGPRR